MVQARSLSIFWEQVKRRASSARDTCDVPLRFIFAFASVLAAGLIGMAGCTVLCQIVYGIALPAASSSSPALLFTALFAAVLVVECASESIHIVLSLVSQLSFLSWARDRAQESQSRGRVTRMANGPPSSPIVVSSTLTLSRAVDAGESSIAFVLLLSAVFAVLFAAIFPNLLTSPKEPLSDTASAGFGTWGEEFMRYIVVIFTVTAVLLLCIIVMVGLVVRSCVGLGRPLFRSGVKPVAEWSRFDIALTVCFTLILPLLLMCLPLARWLAGLGEQYLPASWSVALLAARFGAACDEAYARSVPAQGVLPHEGKPPTEPRARIGKVQAAVQVAFDPSSGGWDNFLSSLEQVSAWYSIIWAGGGLFLFVKLPAAEKSSDTSVFNGLLGVMVLGVVSLASILHGWLQPALGCSSRLQSSPDGTSARSNRMVEWGFGKGALSNSGTTMSADTAAQPVPPTHAATLVQDSVTSSGEEDIGIGALEVQVTLNSLHMINSPIKPTGSLYSSSKVEQVGKRRQLTAEITIARAWGAIILGFSMLGALIGYAYQVSIGLAMSALLFFLCGTMCQSRPHGWLVLGGSRFILSAVACVYVVFNAQVSEDSDKDDDSRMIVSPSGLWNNASVDESGVSRVAYDICSSTMNSLSPLDNCFLSTAVYRKTESSHRYVMDWFAAAGRTVVPVTDCLPPFEPDDDGNFKLLNRNSSQGTLAPGLRYDAYFESLGPLPPSLLLNSSTFCADWTDIYALRGVPGRLFISFRGTKTGSDVASDVLTWVEAAFFEVLSSIGPYASWPEPVKQILLYCVSAVGSSFSLRSGSISFYYAWAPLVPKVYLSILDPLRLNNVTVSVTGHSLGGGLASWTGEFNRIKAVSFSGPGIALTVSKLRRALGTRDFNKLFSSLQNDVGMVVIPDLDVVPLVDSHEGTLQNIACLGPNRNTLTCHSIVRTCCELRRSCGDAFNRTLKACSNYSDSAPTEALA